MSIAFDRIMRRSVDQAVLPGRRLRVPWPVEEAAPAVGRLIPDLNNELVDALGQVEGLLRQLAVAEVETVRPLTLPLELAGGVALEALLRVNDAVCPTQSWVGTLGHRHAARPVPGGGRLFGANGRDEYRPLRSVVLDPTDLDVLRRAGRALAHQVIDDPQGDVAAVVLAAARSARTPGRVIPSAVGLVETFLGVHALLDLAGTDDVRLLRELLATAPVGADVVMTAEQERACERESARLDAVLERSRRQR